MPSITKKNKRPSTTKPSGKKSAGQPTAKERAAVSRLGACPVKPLGVIRTPFPEPKGTPLEPSRAEGARGTVWIDKAYRKALLDLDGFDRVWLLFWLHKAPEGKPLVTPFLDVQQHGLFATRAPARFNPIGLSSVRLLAVHEDHLEVADIDIVDGSPLLDIKPYVEEFDCYPGSRSGWFAANRNPLRVADGRFMKEEAKPAAVPLSISIDGMHCVNCVARVRKTLDGLTGVTVSSVEIGSAVVSYDPAKYKATQIVQAIRSLGFPARQSRKQLKIGQGES